MKTIDYKASLDSSAKERTVLIILSFVLVCYFSFRAFTLSHNNLNTILFPSILLLIFMVTAVTCYLFAPKSYKLDNEKLIIVRRTGDKEIRLDDIVEIRNVDYEMKRAIRLIGLGGLFGYFGKHYALKIGVVTVYASQRKNRLLIQTLQGQKIIITPDDESNMLEKLKELIN